MTARQRHLKAKHAAEHKHMVRRLLAHYVAADGETVMAGRLWYPNASRLIYAKAETFDVNLVALTGIVAVLSPSKRWRENILAAETILLGGRPSNLYPENSDKAERIRDGADPLEIVSGAKVSAFFANLLGSREVVTVDIWGQRAATGRALEEAPKKARYRRLAAAFTSAARMCGETPREFQSIIWHQVRPDREFWRDARALEIY